jgi:hypothetical protein
MELPTSLDWSAFRANSVLVYPTETTDFLCGRATLLWPLHANCREDGADNATGYFRRTPGLASTLAVPGALQQPTREEMARAGCVDVGFFVAQATS